MIDACTRRSSCAAVIATDEYYVCAGFNNTGCNSTNTNFGNELNTYTGMRISDLQVVNKLS